jgi:plastocyanin
MFTRRRLALAALGLILIAGCSASLEFGGGSSSASAPPPPPPAPVASSSVTVNVDIKLFQYNPSAITISPGTTVVWNNDDDINHSVTSGTPDKPSGPLNGLLPVKGSTYSYRFDTPGDYPHYCTYHNSMVGTITVKQP